jgi:hypothetical protein
MALCLLPSLESNAWFFFCLEISPIAPYNLNMYQIKSLALTLCCLIFFVTNISFGSEKVYTRSALVNIKEAIVYADPFLANAIGKISRNITISIGQPVRLNPKVVPVIVSGRVAYIQISDLYINDGSKSDYHNPNLLFEETPENILENNASYIEFHRFNFGTKASAPFQNIDAVNLTQISGVSVDFLHRQTTSNYLWGLGFEYYSTSSQNVSLAFFLIHPTFGFSPLKNMLFNLDLLVSLGFSTGTDFNINTNYHTETFGFMYGPKFSARLVFFPTLEYHLIGTLSYCSYNVVAPGIYYDINEVAYPGISRINGVNASLGIAAEF